MNTLQAAIIPSVSCIAAELLVEQGILIDSCISTGFNPNELIMVVPTKSNHSISPSSCYIRCKPCIGFLAAISLVLPCIGNEYAASLV